MATKRIPITDATDEQIEDFLDMMQLEHGEVKTRTGLLALLETVHNEDHIIVTATDDIIQLEQGEKALPEPQQFPSFGQAYKSDPIWRMKIGTTPLPGGKQPVPVGVNGTVVVIQRDMVVDVPHRFYLALQNAIQHTVTQDSKTRELIEGEVSNYPITQILKAPSPEEIAKWHERTGKIELGAR